MADDICLIRSMHTGVNNHGQSINALNTGQISAGRPALGSWITYALGSESQNLPAFVVLTRSRRAAGAGRGELAERLAAVALPGHGRPPARAADLESRSAAAAARPGAAALPDYLEQLNREHLERHPGEHDLAARIQSYELAARMQTAAKEALDISARDRGHAQAVRHRRPRDARLRHALPDRPAAGRARRAVRADPHRQSDLGPSRQHRESRCRPSAARPTSRPPPWCKTSSSAACSTRTLVHWGGEMGRLPVIQNEKNIGRDHNTYGFSMWLAGGGMQGGTIHGETDEFGHKAVTDTVTHHDYHATLLHLFGLEQQASRLPAPQRRRQPARKPRGPDRLEDSEAGPTRVSGDLSTALLGPIQGQPAALGST